MPRSPSSAYEAKAGKHGQAGARNQQGVRRVEQGVGRVHDGLRHAAPKNTTSGLSTPPHSWQSTTRKLSTAPSSASPSGAMGASADPRFGLAAKRRCCTCSLASMPPQSRHWTRARAPCSSTTARLPAAWCRPSTFWVMTPPRTPRPRARPGPGGPGWGELRPFSASRSRCGPSSAGVPPDRWRTGGAGSGFSPGREPGRAAVVGDAGLGAHPGSRERHEAAPGEQLDQPLYAHGAIYTAPCYRSQVTRSLWSSSATRSVSTAARCSAMRPRAMWRSWIAPDGRTASSWPAALRWFATIWTARPCCSRPASARSSSRSCASATVSSKSDTCCSDSLRAAGFGHEDVDAVVLSHLHFDHAGGLLAAWQRGPVARTPVPERELRGRRALLGARDAPHARDRASFIPALQPLLEASGRLELVERAHSLTLGERLRFTFVDGHTPGLMLTESRRRPAAWCSARDLVPGAPWVHLPITMGYDRCARTADRRETRVPRRRSRAACACSSPTTPRFRWRAWRGTNAVASPRRKRKRPSWG